MDPKFMHDHFYSCPYIETLAQIYHYLDNSSFFHVHGSYLEIEPQTICEIEVLENLWGRSRPQCNCSQWYHRKIPCGKTMKKKKMTTISSLQSVLIHLELTLLGAHKSTTKITRNSTSFVSNN